MNNTQRTLAQAQWVHGDQEDQDFVRSKKNEIEVLRPGHEAAESAYAWSHCTKNPGHGNFIPASDFSLEHLPLKHPDSSEIVDYVKDVAKRTVRLRVRYTSWERPDGYTFSKDRGSTATHVGSGLVLTANRGDGDCNCHECKNSSKPSKEYYKICICTACHVVFNSLEASST